MADWKELGTDDIAVAHVSDLHEGSRESERIWNLASQFLIERVKPKLVLATGDLVDKPGASRYSAAHRYLENLRIPYWVCPGNHDRAFKGLRFGRLRLWDRSDTFNRVFEGRIVFHDRPQTQELVAGKNKWVLGLLGTDSSIDADYVARGHARPIEFDEIVRAAAGKDWDLAVFLVHHHVMPIRRLEERNHFRAGDLLQMTCLVNCGTLLEVLSRARMDLVLHGHEHEHNWAGYSSFVPGYTNLKVVAAGSVTGNDSYEGCSSDRASMNIFILAPNRSVILRRVAFIDGTWKQAEDDVAIFNANELRRSSALRRHSG